MTISKLTISAVSLCLSILTGSAIADTTLIHNVNGYTLTAERELMRFRALKFTDNTIDELYSTDASVPSDLLQSDEVKLVDGENQTLIPGLIDAHGHVLSYGLSLLRVDLTGTSSEAEAAQRVNAFRQLNPGLEWVQGRGWNQELWERNEFPEATSVDDALGSPNAEVPVWLTRVDGHAGWANTAAMEIAGVDVLTVDPDGGQIIRDREGRPTGVFVDNAMDLIRAKIPAPSEEELRLALVNAMESLASQGLTSVHDAGVSARVVDIYKDILASDSGSQASAVPLRISVMLAGTDPAIQQMLAQGFYADDQHSLVIHSVKISADGALGSRGAALIEDYSDSPDHRGLLLHDPERLYELMKMAMEAGFQVNTHAIGDNANKMVLDNYESLMALTDSRDRRHRVEHAQILRYEDIQRFAELGVIASMQATHATSDKNMAQDRLGEIRVQGAYAWRKLLESGAIIANGSDFPVESPNPFFGLHAAVTRQDRDNNPLEGWFPEERMSVLEAFASFTVDAAYAGHQEEVLGNLEPGKLADFILLDRDLFAIPVEEIWQTSVQQTWINGLRVH